VQVDIRAHKILSDGSDYKAKNPKGNVPALVLADGTLFNEGAAVLQWIADQAPQSKLAAAAGTTERYQQLNELNFTATDLHASGYGPLFNPALTGDAKQAQLTKLNGRLAYLNDVILKGGKKFIVGDRYGADAFAATANCRRSQPPLSCCLLTCFAFPVSSLLLFVFRLVCPSSTFTL
jgi:glutathione S-transferase